jgi:GTPase
MADEGPETPFRSGFATLVGRPNVGKSKLLNAIIGEKVSIVSQHAQTTRLPVRGVLTRPDCQLVFVDTPGIHKAVSALGQRLNEHAVGSISDVDIVLLVVDAATGFGRGDRYVADRVPKSAICVVNKIDRVSPSELLTQLNALNALDLAAYFPVSARTGDGVEALVDHLLVSLPVGPAYYPEEMVSDLDDAAWVAELVREQLFLRMREELPYSIATRVTELEWPRIRCEIIVERESQKGMVIGRGGLILKEVGEAVRHQLREGAYVELFVRVDPEWQHKPASVRRFGY